MSYRPREGASEEGGQDMRVVCAYRDPEDGDTALRAIRELVRDDDEVIAIHVVEPGDLPWGRPEGDLVAAFERDMDAREARIGEAVTAAGLQATVVVDLPNSGEGAAEFVAREAGERSADLVVVVSKRASGVRGLLLGSVAQALLRLAPCPVLIVRPPADGKSE
jgi:nucleotide-binding universal stress UspA family protein